MAWSTPTTRSDGYVVPASTWNQDVVDNPIALRAGSLAITSQAANTLIYGSSTTQLAALAAGTQGQILQAGTSGLPAWVGAPNGICQGRLTLTTAVPVTTADVTAAGTLYFTPHGGNQIALYNGSAWQMFGISELSIAVPAAANQVYDAFVDYNSGTPALTLTAWTNDTTRATALTTQNGVLVLTGTLGKRYVGTVRTVTASQLNDSFALRHVWNYYNRKPRPMRVIETADNWNYTTATYQQMNANAANQLDFVIGVAEEPIDAEVIHHAANSTGAVNLSVSIGYDSTTTPATTVTGMLSAPAAAIVTQFQAKLRMFPAIGRHTLVALEKSVAVGTTTWYGDAGAASSAQSGISGWING